LNRLNSKNPHLPNNFRKKITLSAVHEEKVPETITPLEFVKEMFYLTLSQSDLLCYLVVVLVQVKKAFTKQD
jgi:hypothetical protein